ncbi:MAG TPA: hypothetical protein V6D30_03355 [Leptolyngbyaceae cyanobacterium]
MKKKLLIFCGISISIISVVFSQPGVAETKAEQVQQLYGNYIEGAERWVCFGTPDTNRPVTFYQWSRPEQGDDELTLVVHSKEESLLDSCTVSAFEPLRNAAFEMRVEPPRVRLIHYLTDQTGNPTQSSRRVYQCRVPAQLRDHRTDIKYDTAYDLGGFQNLCR